MATGLGFQSDVEVQIIFEPAKWFLSVTLSVSDSLRSRHSGDGFTSLDRPHFSATLDNSQHQTNIRLTPSNDRNLEWQAFQKVLMSKCMLPKLSIEFWMTSNEKPAADFKIGIWEVAFCGTQTVSRQISLHSHLY